MKSHRSRSSLMLLSASALGLSLLCAALPATAQEVTFHGQVRPRYESRDPAAPGGKQFVSMRVRAAVDAALEKDVRIFIQIQDVRLWGEETNTLGDFNADNFDLHQGFIDVKRFTEAPVALRVGRQEINLGGQRLVGAVGWTQQARSFDGARVRFNPGWGSVDLLGYQLADRFAATQDQDAQLFGAYAVVDAGRTGNLDLYGFYQGVNAGADTDQFTLGARLAGKNGGVTYRGELSLQTGDRAGEDVSAYMFGGRLGFDAGSGGVITLWYDYLSGDTNPDDGDSKVFDTMFATNHKFYGVADLFLNIPAHTGGQGLQDMALKGSYRVDSDVTLGLDLHSFRLAKQGALTSAHLGEEIDAMVRYRYSSNLTFQGGLSFVLQDDAWAEIGRLDEDMTWAYVMINAVF